MNKPINNEFDFDGGFRYLEDAQNAELPSDEKTLTDSDLENAGLVKTSAYVRTRRSKNALRIERTREKQKAEGIKQVNVQIPEQHIEIIKQFAKDLAAGSDPTVAAKKIAGDGDFKLAPTQNQSEPKREEAKRPEVSKAVQRTLKLGTQVETIAAKGGLSLLLLKLAGVDIKAL